MQVDIKSRIAPKKKDPIYESSKTWVRPANAIALAVATVLIAGWAWSASMPAPLRGALAALALGAAVWVLRALPAPLGSGAGLALAVGLKALPADMTAGERWPAALLLLAAALLVAGLVLRRGGATRATRRARSEPHADGASYRVVIGVGALIRRAGGRIAGGRLSGRITVERQPAPAARAPARVRGKARTRRRLARGGSASR